MTLAETEPVKLRFFFHEIVSSTNKRNLSFAKGIGNPSLYVYFIHATQGKLWTSAGQNPVPDKNSLLSPLQMGTTLKNQIYNHYKIRFTLSTFVTICGKFISLSTRARVSSQCVFTNLIAAMKRTCWVTFIHVCNDKTNIYYAREFLYQWKESGHSPKLETVFT